MTRTLAVVTLVILGLASIAVGGRVVRPPSDVAGATMPAPPPGADGEDEFDGASSSSRTLRWRPDRVTVPRMPDSVVEDPPPAEATPSPAEVVPDALPVVTTPQGFEALAGSGPVVGAAGRVVTWSVEREPGLPVPMAELADTVTAALDDTDHGWTATGRVRLQRVESGAQVRVVLATPPTVDAWCARAGLRTNSRFSCWVDGFAMLNVDRWIEGAAPHPDLATYRTYLVNHEVGHGLGFGHAGCPAADAPAPVMMQQTKGVGACAPNGFPVP